MGSLYLFVRNKNGDRQRSIPNVQGTLPGRAEGFRPPGLRQEGARLGRHTGGRRHRLVPHRTSFRGQDTLLRPLRLGEREAERPQGRQAALSLQGLREDLRCVHGNRVPFGQEAAIDLPAIRPLHDAGHVRARDRRKLRHGRRERLLHEAQDS